MQCSRVDGNQCFESSSALLVPFYQTKWHHIPQDNNLFPERCKSLSEKRSFTTKKILGIEQSDLLLTQGKTCLLVVSVSCYKYGNVLNACADAMMKGFSSFQMPIKCYSYYHVCCHYFLSKTRQTHFPVPNEGHCIQCYLQLKICCKTLFQYVVQHYSTLLSLLWRSLRDQ